MTLGSWVKSYLYIPMGGNRNGEFSKMRNLFLAMLIVGFWHGAGWTFIIWGGIHGSLLMLNHQWRRLNLRLPKVICWGLTFFSVVIAWVFFRAENIWQAMQILSSMFDFNSISTSVETWRMGKNVVNTWSTIAGLGVLLCLPNPIIIIDKFRPNWGWFALSLVLLLVSFYQLNTYTEFLYFQF